MLREKGLLASLLIVLCYVTSGVCREDESCTVKVMDNGVLVLKAEMNFACSIYQARDTTSLYEMTQSPENNVQVTYYTRDSSYGPPRVVIDEAGSATSLRTPMYRFLSRIHGSQVNLHDDRQGVLVQDLKLSKGESLSSWLSETLKIKCSLVFEDGTASWFLVIDMSISCADFVETTHFVPTTAELEKTTSMSFYSKVEIGPSRVAPVDVYWVLNGLSYLQLNRVDNIPKGIISYRSRLVDLLEEMSKKGVGPSTDEWFSPFADYRLDHQDEPIFLVTVAIDYFNFDNNVRFEAAVLFDSDFGTKFKKFFSPPRGLVFWPQQMNLLCTSGPVGIEFARTDSMIGLTPLEMTDGAKLKLWKQICGYAKSDQYLFVIETGIKTAHFSTTVLGGRTGSLLFLKEKKKGGRPQSGKSRARSVAGSVAGSGGVTKPSYFGGSRPGSRAGGGGATTPSYVSGIRHVSRAGGGGATTPSYVSGSPAVNRVGGGGVPKKTGSNPKNLWGMS